MKETPGAQLPWSEIQHLLTPSERFEISSLDWRGFLLAPRHSSQLAALLYLLSQQNIFCCVQGKGHENHPLPHQQAIVSIRAFSQLIFHEQGIVEAGAGASLKDLCQFLSEQHHEIALEENLLSSEKRSIASIILFSKAARTYYRHEMKESNLLGVEFVTWKGEQIKWGGPYRSPLAGPALHRLINGFEGFPGIITKFYFKISPIPETRLRLAWSFYQREELWDYFQTLKNFCLSWESLDCVQSGDLKERGWIFAQISGSKEEMQAFSLECPRYKMATMKNERKNIRKFLKNHTLNMYESSLVQHLELGEYLWMEGLSDRVWWLTPKSIEKDLSSPPLWKDWLSKSLM